MRTITLYTSTNDLKKINTEVTTFGDLKPLIVEEGIDINKMEATESINKSVLKHDNTALPSGNFVVFLTTRNKEAGAKLYPNLSHREVVGKVSDLLSEFGTEADSHFNSEKNFTRMKGAELREKLQEWEVSMGEVSEDEPVKESVAPIAEAPIGECGPGVPAKKDFPKESIADMPGRPTPPTPETPSYIPDLVKSQEALLAEVREIKGIIQNFYEEKLDSSTEEEKAELRAEMRRIGLS